MRAQPQPAQPQPAQRPIEGVRAYQGLVRAVSGRGALLLAFLWGLAEAALLFVVPDVWLGFVCLYAPRRLVVTLLAVVAGAVVGGALLLLTTPRLGDELTGMLVGLPGIRAADLAQAQAELAAQGVAAFLNGPLQGLPVKLHLHGAALAGMDPAPVLVATALNRVERVGLFGLAMAITGVLARPLIARWPRAVAVLYAAAWVIFYLAFWSARVA